MDPSIRSMMALQEERGSTTYGELQNEITKKSVTQLMDSEPSALKWSRLPGQVRAIWTRFGFCRMKLAYYSEALLTTTRFNKAFLLKVCRIPNKPMLSFRGGQLGCLTVLFSHAGTMLAAACADRDSFPVVGR